MNHDNQPGISNLTCPNETGYIRIPNLTMARPRAIRYLVSASPGLVLLPRTRARSLAFNYP